MTQPTNDQLVTYTLRHADDCLVLSHRLAEWSSRAPDVEEDIALTNVGLDLLGQARLLYQNAANVEGTTEDSYAYTRTERQFTNLLLVEQPNGDFATSIARQLFFSTYQQLLWQSLSDSADESLAGVAAKASKEVAYHLRHTRTWMRRLGDGTPESHDRTQMGLESLWRYTDEMFSDDALDITMLDTAVGVLPSTLKDEWLRRIENDVSEATLAMPTDPYQTSGGREGRHTNHLGLMLAEMQVLARTYPGATW